MRVFGAINGLPVHEVTLRNGAGAIAKVLSWGAVLRDLVVPRPGGDPQRVVLGLNSLEDYTAHSPHFGAIAGRYANRIAHGRFTLDGLTHQLPLNQEGKHSLHGGGNGFGKLPWVLLQADATSCTLGIVSPDGEAGYPGALNVNCRYALTKNSALRVELWAFTDKPTILNLCHHSYFNLDGGTDILDHTLAVRANVMTPVDADLIPDGSLAPVSGTPFDFRKPRAIRLVGPDGKRFWYDHNFVLRRERRESDVSGIEIAHAATLSSARSGISMEVWTSEPCLQVYDGFKVNTPVMGLDGARYGANAGICLEPQHAPDSPNLPHLPSTVLRPGDLYRQVTEYRF
ncbi:MAG: galactose mutarotase [Rhizobiales bacterium]|nr:galactose mutarotase [Hyphomicrobiales bacterium]